MIDHASNTGRPPATPLNEWLQRGMMFTLVLACVLAISKSHADPDLWGHVRYGQDMIASGLPEKATYTYTAAGHRWINHEILSELFLATAVATVGPTGLLTFKCLLGGVLMSVLIRRIRLGGGDLLTTFVVPLLVAASLMHFWSLRPQLFSFVYFTAMVLLVSWCFRGDVDRRDRAAWRRTGWLWLLAPLFAAWVNTHGGFVLGLALLAGYLAGRSVEAVWMLRRDGWRLVLRMACVWMACAAATLANPYGYELHEWLTGSLGSPRPEIIEWRAPELLSVIWAPFWIVAALFVAAVLGTRRRRDYVELAVTALVLWQSIEHRRHIPFFVLLFGFWFAMHVQSLFDRFRRSETSDFAAGLTPAMARIYAVGLALAIALISWTIVDQVRRIPVRRDSYPVAAIEYIADRQFTGKLVVRFKWAQYAIYALGDQGIDVAFDGRFRTCYPQWVIDMYFDFAAGNDPREPRHRSRGGPPPRAARILDFEQPNLVLIDRKQLHAAGTIAQQRDRWVLLYQDEIAQLWGRATVYDDPASPQYISLAERSIGDDAQPGIVSWPAVPARRRGPVQLADQAASQKTTARPIP